MRVSDGVTSVAETITVRVLAVPLLVTGADAGGGAHVRVHDARDASLLYDIFPYPGFGGGVRVAVGDVNGDGYPDIITAPGAGGSPHVKVYDGRNPNGLPLLANFFAYYTDVHRRHLRRGGGNASIFTNTCLRRSLLIVDGKVPPFTNPVAASVRRARSGAAGLRRLGSRCERPLPWSRANRSRSNRQPGTGSPAALLVRDATDRPPARR